MTASGPCHVCGETASTFLYRTPNRLPDGRHNGEWWCDEHDPRRGKSLIPEMTSPQTKDGLSRRERRALARKKK